jgi:hypothetical protein
MECFLSVAVIATPQKTRDFRMRIPHLRAVFTA